MPNIVTLMRRYGRCSPLINGGKCVIPDSDLGFDPTELVRLIDTNGVTHTDMVPTTMELFISHLEANPEAVHRARTLWYVLAGGEALQSEAVKRFRRILPDVTLLNTYGANETSIEAVFLKLTGKVPDPIPVRVPIANTTAVIVDANKQVLPIGALGQICLGGLCVGG